VSFDLARLEVRGTPAPLLQDVAANMATGGGQFDFSAGGTFVYAAGTRAAQAWTIASLDGSGKIQPLVAVPGTYGTPHFSPDGRKLSYNGDGSDVYSYDLERQTPIRLTFSGNAVGPIWAPDGKHIVGSFSSRTGIDWMRSDVPGSAVRLLDTSDNLVPWSFSPDGRWLAYFTRNQKTGFDLWTLPLDLTDPDHPKAGKPEPFLQTPADEIVPRFSPDGRWIAYRSNELGIDEVYVRPFPPGSGAKWQISSGGGLYGLWSRNGHELFYETEDNQIMVLDYSVEGPSFVPGKPRLWSSKRLFFTGTSNLDLMPDGKHFAVFAVPEAAGTQAGSVHVTMLLNFFDEVRRKVPSVRK
jgi:serine/threonine-protein kinase